MLRTRQRVDESDAAVQAVLGTGQVDDAGQGMNCESRNAVWGMVRKDGLDEPRLQVDGREESLILRQPLDQRMEGSAGGEPEKSRVEEVVAQLDTRLRPTCAG